MSVCKQCLDLRDDLIAKALQYATLLEELIFRFRAGEMKAARDAEKAAADAGRSVVAAKTALELHNPTHRR